MSWLWALALGVPALVGLGSGTGAAILFGVPFLADAPAIAPTAMVVVADAPAAPPTLAVTTTSGATVTTSNGPLASTSADTPTLVVKVTTPGEVVRETLTAALAVGDDSVVDTN